MLVVDLGELNRPTSLDIQPPVRQRVIDDDLPELWLVHTVTPLVTLAPASESDDLLRTRAYFQNRGIVVSDDDRTGGASYHGPGQIILVPIVRIDTALRDFAFTMADGLVATLAAYGLTADRGDEFPGAWVGGKACGFVGVSESQAVTGGGIALNVNVDLEPFNWINPCGMGEVVTSMAAELGAEQDEAAVRAALLRQLVGEIELVGPEAIA